MVDYFAYGSNLWRPRLEGRVGPVAIVGVAALAGFGLRWHKRSQDGSGKCDIIPSPKETVIGVVYRFPVDRLRDLDKAEDVGNGYYRDDLVTVSLTDKPLSVCAYRAQETHIDDTLLPYCWYHDYVMFGARAHGFPADYIAMIARQPTQVDSSPQRATANDLTIGPEE